MAIARPPTCKDMHVYDKLQRPIEVKSFILSCGWPYDDNCRKTGTVLEFQLRLELL